MGSDKLGFLGADTSYIKLTCNLLLCTINNNRKRSGSFNNVSSSPHVNRRARLLVRKWGRRVRGALYVERRFHKKINIEVRCDCTGKKKRKGERLD